MAHICGPRHGQGAAYDGAMRLCTTRFNSVATCVLACMTSLSANAAALSLASTLPAPQAQQIPYTVKSPQGDRVDEYHWLRDDDPKAKRPEVMRHLQAEMPGYFANARSVRNALDRARLRQASRLFADRDRALTRDDLTTLEPEDIRASRVFQAATH